MLLLVGCSSKSSVEEKFMADLTDSKSYKVEGKMETFYDDDRKENEFVVFYKEPDLIKVTIKSLDNNDQQIILKNPSGVFVLIPAVNKNFKIQSSWPQNASYPYLLQSIAKDIANQENILRVENETTVEVETDTKMHTDANVVKQKIIFDKVTALPTEVKVYDDEGDLYIRCVFQNIELDYNIAATEFEIKDSITYARLEYGEEGLVFENRTLDLPSYFPAGSVLNSQSKKNNQMIMKYTGDYGFTIIQEFIDDAEEVYSQEEDGRVIMILGNVALLTNTSLRFVYEGIEYTIASEEIVLDEVIKIAQSYMVESGK
jgi:outer membrane lipoprotein-sorting protein